MISYWMTETKRSLAIPVAMKKTIRWIKFELSNIELLLTIFIHFYSQWYVEVLEWKPYLIWFGHVDFI